LTNAVSSPSIIPIRMLFQVLALSVYECLASRAWSIRLSRTLTARSDNPTACIRPECRIAPTPDADSEVHLCYAAYQNSQVCTKAWTDLLDSVADSDCRDSLNKSARECTSKAHDALVHEMFGAVGCSETALCSIASAKINAYSVACQKVTDGYRSFFCNDVIIASDVEGLRDSLHCPCTTLNDGGGRSGAVLQITSDGRYIIKGIKKSEMPVLVEMRDEFESQELLSKWSYVDPKNSLVIMPNSHDVSVQGVRATLGVASYSMGEECDAMRGGELKVSNSGRWDVKPLPIKSPHRRKMLAILAERQWKPNGMHGWGVLTKTVERNLIFLNEHDLIDYSLLFSLFEIPATPASQCELWTEVSSKAPTQCLIQDDCEAGRRAAPIPIEYPRNFSGADRLHEVDGDFVVGNPTAMQPWSNGILPSALLQRSSSQGKCEVLCVTIIDYLMVFGTTRRMENVVKGGRWTKYKTKSLELWECVGDLQRHGCEKYLALACQELEKTRRSSSWCSSSSLTEQAIDDEGDLEDFFHSDSDSGGSGNEDDELFFGPLEGSEQW